jgi:hypothetical protein
LDPFADGPAILWHGTLTMEICALSWRSQKVDALAMINKFLYYRFMKRPA